MLGLATLAATVAFHYSNNPSGVVHHIAISGLIAVLILSFCSLFRPRIQTSMYFLIMIVALCLNWTEIQESIWQVLYQWVTYWGFRPVNNPQYIIVIAYGVVFPCTLSLIKRRNRSFDRLLIWFLLCGTILSTCLFHYLVIHTGFMGELDQRQAENSVILDVDLSKPEDVQDICDKRGISCTTANIKDEDFSKMVRFQNEGVQRIISDTIQRRHVAFSWREMEQVDLRAVSSATTLFYKKQDDEILIGNDLMSSSEAGDRYFFILYALVSCFTWVWITAFALLKTFHEKRFYSRIDHREEIHKIFDER